jgi:glycosyltransferase involved in cell wall biosynthesis
MNPPVFSVVIPTFNRKAALLRCLAHLERQSIAPDRFEVIVVVDGSGDDTASDVRARPVPFRLQVLEIERVGPGGARNAGAAKASGDYLAFTEDDVEISPSWLAYAERHLSETGSALLEGATLDAESGRSVRRFDADRRPSFIPCNLFVSRKVFLELAGYSTEYFDRSRSLYFREDAEFGFRLLDAGYRVAFAEDVVVKHPPQFTTVEQCFRHARRYEFDPLLCSRHARRFHELIEVKRILGLTIRRPQHYVALLSVLGLLGFFAGLFLMRPFLAAAGMVAVFTGGILFAFKYRGSQILRFASLPDLFRLLPLPFVYFAAVLRGCYRHRTLRGLL